MVGISLSLLLRLSIPSSFICSRCSLLLSSPILCPNCSLLCCESCAIPNSNCDHKAKEPQKLLDAKLKELYIKCFYYRHGCVKVVRIKEIDAHEKECDFKKIECNDKACQHDNGAERLSNHVRICEYDLVEREEAGEKSKNLIQRENHNCSKFLKEIVESIEIRNKVIEDENSELIVELEQNDKIHSENVAGIEKKIHEVNQTNDELLAEIQRLKLNYEAQISELESQSAFKMKVIHSEKDVRISNYLKKTGEGFDSFEQTTKNQINEYSKDLKEKIDGFLGKIEREAQNVGKGKSSPKKRG